MREFAHFIMFSEICACSTQCLADWLAACITACPDGWSFPPRKREESF